MWTVAVSYSFQICALALMRPRSSASLTEMLKLQVSGGTPDQHVQEHLTPKQVGARDNAHSSHLLTRMQPVYATEPSMSHAQTSWASGSPFGRYMESEDADPVGTYTHLIERLNDIGIMCVAPVSNVSCTAASVCCAEGSIYQHD